jgi:hypothetical protein
MLLTKFIRIILKIEVIYNVIIKIYYVIIKISLDKCCYYIPPTKY